MNGDLLVDDQFSKNLTFRKYKLQKKMCQETWPGRAGDEPYGEPFEFFEHIGTFETLDVSHLKFRQEWRTFFAETLGLGLKEGVTLPEIETLEERIAQRQAAEEEKAEQ